MTRTDVNHENHHIRSSDSVLAASTWLVKRAGTVPRANGTHDALPEPAGTGSPDTSLARTKVTSVGGVKSRGGVSGCAERMNSSQIGSAVVPPVVL